MHVIRHIWAGLAIAAAALLLAGASSPAAARGLTLGFDDYGYMAADRGTQALWFQRTKDVGGQIVRLNAPWSSIAPAKRPEGFNASRPASPGYDWQALDAAVNDARARGLKVLITLS